MNFNCKTCARSLNHNNNKPNNNNNCTLTTTTATHSHLRLGNDVESELQIDEGGSGLREVALVGNEAASSEAARAARLVHPLCPLGVQVAVRFLVLWLEDTDDLLRVCVAKGAWLVLVKTLTLVRVTRHTYFIYTKLKNGGRKTNLLSSLLPEQW